MSYSTINAINKSPSLMDRCVAAVASEVSAGNTPGDSRLAPGWVTQRSWDLASTPGWAAKWESAEAGGIADPGANEGVITDLDILSRIQSLLIAYPLTDVEPGP